MLNYFFLSQITILMILFFIIWITDFLILIIFGILYLLLISIISLTYDSDILISFLIIIDFGVFFILLSFCIHLLKFLNYKYIFINLIKNIFIYFIIMFTVLLNLIILININLNIKFIFSWFFLLNYLNYYSINWLIFVSDMHIFKEIYFNINSFEFILISFLLIIVIVLIYLFSNLIVKMNISFNFKDYNVQKLINKKNNSYYFFKIQINSNQYNVPASCRVFNKLKYDSKINYTVNNR